MADLKRVFLAWMVVKPKSGITIVAVVFLVFHFSKVSEKARTIDFRANKNYISIISGDTGLYLIATNISTSVF